MRIIFSILILISFNSSIATAEIIWRDGKGYIVNNKKQDRSQKKGNLQPKDWKTYSFQKQQKTLRSSVTNRGLKLDQAKKQKSFSSQNKYGVDNKKSIHSGFSEKNLKKLMIKREMARTKNNIPNRIIADKMLRNNRFVTNKDFGINDNNVVMPRNNSNIYRNSLSTTYKMSNNNISNNQPLGAPIKLYNPK